MRIRHDKNRPIVQRTSKEDLHALYLSRRKYYREAAHIVVKTEARTLKNIVEYIAFQVNRLKGE